MNREAYLDALGITQWTRRGLAASAEDEANAVEAAPETPVLKTSAVVPDKSEAPRTDNRARTAQALGMSLGPGEGSCLFLCGSEDDTATALASDLARLLPVAPVWAQTAINGDGLPLQKAVEERLFTAVVIFGQAQALLALGGAAPERCGAARVVVAPELKRLASDPEARKSCWQAFKSLGLDGAR